MTEQPSQPSRYMDGYGQEDMVTPEIKLIQSLGGQIAKDQGAVPGDFYLPLTDELFKGASGLKLVIVDILKTRTYWGRSEIDAEPPECASADARSMLSLFGNDCSICPKKVDNPGLLDNKEERRSMCLTGFTILAIRADESRQPVLIRAHGINATPTRNLITILKTNRQIKGAYEKALIGLTSHFTKTASGEAYMMAFAPLAVIEDALAAEFLRQTQQLLGSYAATALPEGELPAELPSTTLPEAVAVTVPAPEVKVPVKEGKEAQVKEAKPAEPKQLPTTDLNF